MAQPRGLNIGKAFELAGNTELARKYQDFNTMLKPSCEPMVLAQKACEGTFIENVSAYGVGGLNIGATRIGESGAESHSNKDNGGRGHGVYKGLPVSIKHDLGRYPSNTILTHSVGCQEGFCVGDCVVKAFSAQQGDTISDFWHANHWDLEIDFPFIYSAKATTQEKEAGLEHLPNIYNEALGVEESKKNSHPTVKPWRVMEWLIKCVTPPGGKVLDPFGGSGTTGIAALKNGFEVTLIEKTPEYREIIEGRLAFTLGKPIATETKKQMKLF